MCLTATTTTFYPSLQLNIYQDNLKQKTAQLHAMDEELAMYKQQVAEFRYDIDMYQQEMNDLKMAWIKAKRQAVAAAKREQSLPLSPSPPLSSASSTSMPQDGLKGSSPLQQDIHSSNGKESRQDEALSSPSLLE